MQKKILPIILGLSLILASVPVFASVDNYPGFKMSTYKDSYSIDEEVQLELEKINPTIDSYYVDVFASKQLAQGTSDVFLVEPNVLVSSGKKIVYIDLDEINGFVSGGNADYTISVCSTNGCTMTTTNAITITLDTDLTISNIEASSVTSEAFYIGWQTNGDYDCTMIYSIKDGNLDDDLLISTRDADDYIFGSNYPKSDSNGNYKYAIEIKNQGENTKYFNGDKGYYNLICYDNDRNKATSSVYTFDFPFGSDKKNPIISNIEVPYQSIGIDRATITWNTNVQTDSIVYYAKAGSNNWSWQGTDDFSKNHFVKITGLQSFTTYQYYINAKDSLKNLTKSDTLEFTTTYDSGNNNSDIIQFSNINVPTSLIRPTAVTVNWTTNYPTNSDVHYWSVDGNHENWNWDKIDDYTQTSHSIVLKNLTPFTTYKFTVSGQKKAGVPKTTSKEYSFTTTIDGGSDIIDDNNINNDKDSINQLVPQLQRQISALEKQVIELEKKLTQLDQKFAEKYAGTMLLDVENHGRLWYVDPLSKNRFYFENGEAALSIGSKLATGITYDDIQKIPVGVPNKLYNLQDTDSDGLPDRLESALGSDPNKNDTDGDGFNDKGEVENGYNPMTNVKYDYSQNLVDRLEGKMLLQVSGPNSHGEIWYIKDGKRWYGGTEDSMYEIMKARSLGAKPDDIRKIEVGDVRGVK